MCIVTVSNVADEFLPSSNNVQFVLSLPSLWLAVVGEACMSQPSRYPPETDGTTPNRKT